MANELIEKNDEQVVINAPSESDYANAVQFVTEKTNEINIISMGLIEAQNAAKNALSKVEEVKGKAVETQRKVQTIHKPTLFRKKRTIEEMRTEMINMAENEVDLANSQEVLAEAQQRFSEAQNKSFEFQKKLAQATATMIAFSVTSIAQSRMVVREIEARLQGASEEELSDLARKELENVLDQIKAQQDMMGRQNQLTEILEQHDQGLKLQDQEIRAQAEEGLRREQRILALGQMVRDQHRVLDIQNQKVESHNRALNEIIGTNAKQDELIAQGIEKNKEQDAALSEIIVINVKQDELIAQGIEKNKEQDVALSKIIATNVKQDELIVQGIEKNKEQDVALSEIIAINAKQDELIAKCNEKNNEQDEYISEIIKINQEQSELIDGLQQQIETLKIELQTKGNKKLLVASVAVAGVALIISILQFLF